MLRALGPSLQGALPQRQSSDGCESSPGRSAGPKVVSGPALVTGGGSGLPPGVLGKRPKCTRNFTWVVSAAQGPWCTRRPFPPPRGHGR